MNKNYQLREKKTNFVKSIFIVLKHRAKSQGYTLPEMITAMIMMTIIGAVAPPVIVHNDPVSDGINQFQEILKQAQARAVSTTSAIRIKPDEDNPTQKLTTEIANIRSCQSTTELAESASGSDTEIIVVSTDGLNVGDELIIGGDSDNNQVIGMTPDEGKIFLGSNLGSSQSKGSKVELSKKWEIDSALLSEDLTLPKNAEISADITDWTICVNSRGVVYIYDDKEEEQPELLVTVKNGNGGNEEEITLLKGGAIKTD